MSPTFLLESSSRTYTEAIQVFLKPYVKKTAFMYKRVVPTEAHAIES